MIPRRRKHFVPTVSLILHRLISILWEISECGSEVLQGSVIQFGAVLSIHVSFAVCGRYEARN